MVSIGDGILWRPGAARREDRRRDCDGDSAFSAWALVARSSVDWEFSDSEDVLDFVNSSAGGGAGVSGNELPGSLYPDQDSAHVCAVGPRVQMLQRSRADRCALKTYREDYEEYYGSMRCRILRLCAIQAPRSFWFRAWACLHSARIRRRLALRASSISMRSM